MEFRRSLRILNNKTKERTKALTSMHYIGSVTDPMNNNVPVLLSLIA